MIASELAMELGVDAGAFSKRLSQYFKESGRAKSRFLDGETVAKMREVHQLLESNEARTGLAPVMQSSG